MDSYYSASIEQAKKDLRNLKDIRGLRGESEFLIGKKGEIIESLRDSEVGQQADQVGVADPLFLLDVLPFG